MIMVLVAVCCCVVSIHLVGELEVQEVKFPLLAQFCRCKSMEMQKVRWWVGTYALFFLKNAIHYIFIRVRVLYS